MAEILSVATAVPPYALGVMLAVGAGVSCEMALVRGGGWLSAGQGVA